MLEVQIYKKLHDYDLNVNFKVENGIQGFMGSSGSGKSMTLKCIAGIEKPDKGRIVLDGNVLYDSDLKINVPIQKRNIGFSFQNYALFENMTIFENVACPLKARKEKYEEKVETILTQLHIDHLKNRYPRQLSGGERQRVALARIMVYHPSLILLDEPFSALDEDLKEDLLKEMKQELLGMNVPVLFVSHSRYEIETMCSSYIKINKGKII
ncbi:ATP-binding cassette domain-containing protein [Floccifex sp.]|uniref:ATP-binding cassette domain-containing protein n=1 Tax=Floccifex sp. TaxID=2815810 RepID=UPI002A750C90|nr:ATP-binding cassette domain-containing protein [Floccifex sp.]MDD7281368.1 ATP-binding cassette domain-containing protein [Erysipelotrichaceae bacterium]MDY2958893.1 ATP-binding cassette domain-containing protein [Floccifex sp.]